jgi:hypothetical protein
MGEVELFGVYFSGLVPAFLLAVISTLIMQPLLRRARFYQFVWHSNLADLCVFVILWGSYGWLLARHFGDPV